jgi:hypothetical protein
MRGEIIEDQGSLVVVLNKPFLDRVLLKADEDAIALAIVDKIMGEVINHFTSTWDYTALQQEVSRQVKHDVGRIVLSQYDYRIRAAVKAVMLKAEKDFEDERVKQRKAEVNKRTYARRKAKREAEKQAADARD